MRNLKKFLALVLAMMMALSLMVTANATTAADFSDSAKLDPAYKEATDVMLAIGAIYGKDGNTLDPKGGLKRAELAILLYTVNMGNKGDNDAVLAAMTNLDQFNDVRNTSYQSWAGKYINYAATEDWMHGVGGGKFDPSGSVSMPMMLLSMLNVLKLSDTVNPNTWEIDSIRLAQTYGIDAGIDLTTKSAYRDVTREEAFQIAFNALTYTVTGAKEYVVLDRYGKPQPFDNRTDAMLFLLSELNAKMEEATDGSVPVNQAAYVGEQDSIKDSLLAKTYGVKKTIGNTDKLGRPTIDYQKNDLTLVSIPQTPDYYFNGNLTAKVAKEVEKALGTDAATLLANSYYNGVKVTDAATPAWRQDTATPNGTSGLWIDDTNGIPGLEIYIYKTSAETKVIICEAYLVEVGKAAVGNPKTINVIAHDVSNAGTVNFNVPNTTEIHETFADHQNDYMAVYFKPGWDAALNGQTVTDALSDEYILQVDALDGVDFHVAQRSLGNPHMKYNSQVRELRTDAWYGFANEAVYLWGTVGDTPVTNYEYTSVDMLDTVNPTDTAKSPVSIVHLGSSVVYLHNGFILLLDQREGATAPADPTQTYAYFYDVIEKHPGVTGDNLWDSEGGNTGTPDDVYYLGRLLNPDGSEIDRNGVEIKLPAGYDVGKPGINYDDYEAYLGSLVYYTKDAKTGVYTIYPITADVLGTLNDGTIDFSGEKWLDTQVNIGVVGGTRWGNGTLEVTQGKSEAVFKGGKVAFDNKTMFLVVKTGEYRGNPIFDYEVKPYTIYNIDKALEKVESALVTVVKKIDSNNVAGAAGNPDGLKVNVNPADKQTEIARVVLVIDQSALKKFDAPQSVTGTYFIVNDPKATQEYVYIDETLTGAALEAEENKIWYYAYDAVVDGEYRKVMVEKSVAEDATAGSIYFRDTANPNSTATNKMWLTIIDSKDIKEAGNGKYHIIMSAGTPVKGANVVFIDTMTQWENDHVKINGYTYGDDDNVDQTVKPGILKSVGIAKQAGTKVEDYLVSTAKRKAFVFDAEKGTITTISVDDLTAKIIKNTYNGDGSSKSFAIRSAGHTIDWLLLNGNPDAIQ